MRRILVYCSLSLVAAAVLLSGCGKKNIMNVQFDEFTLSRDAQDKQYIATTPVNDANIMYQAIEDTTGTASSLIVSKVVIPWATDAESLVQANYDQLNKKLLNFKGDKLATISFSCNQMRLTWYILDFSYDIDQQQHFYAYQYYFVAHSLLYTISFNSLSSKDVKAVKKSIKHIECR